MFSLGKHSIRFLILVACSVPAFGWSPGETPVPAPFPSEAKLVEGILVPVPSEVFRSLDEFHEANWLKVQRPEVHRWKSRGDQVQIALLLGTVVAEGFIAMEAEDSAEVKRVGAKVLLLARALGVEHSVLRRSRSIVDYADKGEWAAARKEWDGALSDLEEQMIATDSQPLLQLVSLGGWLRGTEALCGLVGQDFSTAHSKMIRQPAMLDYLEKQLVGMRGKMRNHTVVVKMLEGLRKIRSLMEEESGDLSKQTVKEIGKSCSELVTVFSHRPT